MQGWCLLWWSVPKGPQRELLRLLLGKVLNRKKWQLGLTVLFQNCFLLGVKSILSYAHKIGSWHLLRVLVKICDKHSFLLLFFLRILLLYHNALGHGTLYPLRIIWLAALKVRRTGSTLRIDSWIRWRWNRKPLCFKPPSTRRWPALGVTSRISLTYSSRSSLETSLKFSLTPTGNPNSCLRQCKVLSEIPKILPISAQRKPASLCRVCSCCCKICSLGLPTKPFLATIERRSFRDNGAVNVERSESSKILSKSLKVRS